MKDNYKKSIKLLLISSLYCLASGQFSTSVYALNTEDNESFNSIQRVSDTRSQYVLTEDSSNQTETYFSDGLLNLNFDFNLTFKVNLGNNQSGGEGIAFVLHNDPRGVNARGDGGECLGVYQCSSTGSFIENALALEFDTNYTVNNSHAYGSSDLSVDNTVNINKTGHIAITVPASRTTKHYNTQFSTSNTLADGNDRTVNVRWNAQTKQLIYTVEGFSQQVHSLADYLSVFGGDTVYWGFTGATSTNTNKQIVTVTTQPNQSSIINAAVSKDAGKTWNQNIALSRDDIFYIQLKIRVPNAENMLNIIPSETSQYTITEAKSSDTSVSLVNNGKTIQTGAIPKNQTITITLKAVAHQIAGNTGFTFSLANSENFGTSNNIVVTPVNYLTLKYDSNGGINAPDNQKTYAANSTVSILPAGSMSYGKLTFTSWNSSADGSGTPYLPGQTITLRQSLVLYAQWSSQTALLTVYINHPMAEKTVETYPLNVSQSLPLASLTYSFDGYVLEGFNTKKDGSGTAYTLTDTLTISSDLTLYAQWSKQETITITLDAGKYGILNENTHILINKGDYLTSLPTPETQGDVKFVGWMYKLKIVDIAATSFTEDATLTAVYSVNGMMLNIGDSWSNNSENALLKITFNSGEYGTVVYDTYLYAKNQKIMTRPRVTADNGYVFTHWSLNDEVIDFETFVVTEPVQLDANYTKSDIESLQNLNDTLTYANKASPIQETLMKSLIILIGAGIIIFALKSDLKSRKKDDKEDAS